MITAAISGWILVSWKILSSASTFLAFMGGYAAPVSGIMEADYWLVKRTYYDILGKSQDPLSRPSCLRSCSTEATPFSTARYNPSGSYRFNTGCNWRAAIAFLVPVVLPLLGLAYSISAYHAVQISVGVIHMYTSDWLSGSLSP